MLRMLNDSPSDSASSSYIRRNPFQKTGSKLAHELIETKTACFMRVDMPGCLVKDMSSWIDGNNIHFFADEPNGPAGSLYDGRKYGGSMVFMPDTYNVNDAKIELKDGVLWVTVPKHVKTAGKP